MASGSGEKKDIPAKGNFQVYRSDPNGIFAPTPSGIMWKSRTITIDGVEMKNISFPVQVGQVGPRREVRVLEDIGDLSKKINDTKAAEAEIARQKAKEEEMHKARIREYEARIQKLEEQLNQVSLSIKKKDPVYKFPGFFNPHRSKILHEEGFTKRVLENHLAHSDPPLFALAQKGLKCLGVDTKMHDDLAAGRIRLRPGVLFVPDPPTQPQKRKIDEVYEVHDSDDEDVVIVGEWPCEKKGAAVQKNQESRVNMYSEEDPQDDSIVEKWMKA